MKRRRKILITLILILATAQIVIFGYLMYINWPGVDSVELGVTFSPSQARYLGVDPHKVLIASLDDLGIKKYRISAYWNIVEKTPSRYDFSEIDWQLDEIEKRGGKIIMAVGRRLPRWPECHDPDWAEGRSEEYLNKKTLVLIEKTVLRYRNRGVIESWQVENEPLLTIFGKCPQPNKKFYKSEVDLVRELDPNRPIVITESGELATWLNAAILGDKVGISVYRTTWDKYLGMFYYPLTPSYYKYRARALRALGKDVYVSELQAEPWERNPLPQTPLVEQKIFMNSERIKTSLDFVRRAGFNEVYLWGVEWWYWLDKVKGDPDMWDAIKNYELRIRN